MSAVVEDILPDPQSPIILPPSLVCLCGLVMISSISDSSFCVVPHLVALEGFTESVRGEMYPEWNIQATIIEPGGFNTEIWSNINTATLPLHPAYDTGDNSPTKQNRAIITGKVIPFVGSSENAAKAFITLAEKKDLPLRVQFGTDSLIIVRHAAMKTISDSEKFESLSHSTNMDGIDSKEYAKNLLAALG